MGSYELRIKPSALKELERIRNRKDRRRIVAKIEALAEDPRPVGSEKLTAESRYRVRQGWYRILCTIDDPESAVVIVKIGHRRDVYR